IKALMQERGLSMRDAKDMVDAYFREYDKATGRKVDLKRPINAKKAAVYDRRKAADEAGLVSCPKCGSTSVTAGERGLSVGRTVVGSAAFGIVPGLLLGSIGSGQTMCTCLKCGYKWKPGKK
ncbi:MAG: hypothetical protein ACI4OI_02380, partial [Gemmiger sp.]